MNKYALAIHGGAGTIKDVSAYRESLRYIIDEISKQAELGEKALNLVTKAVCMLEDDPLFNAGRGSVINAVGEVECDASLMDGKNMRAGAVAGLRGIKNPISLARDIMEKSPHVMLIGEGARQFGKSLNYENMPDSYFITEARLKQLEEAKKTNKIVLDHSDTEEKMGTVGAVAIDAKGNLAAATSTGGIVNKKYGRVGDSPVIGAGTYAENGLCAVSATGYGEQFLRTSLSKHIAEWMRYNKVDASLASENGVNFLTKKVNGLGGVIVVDSMYKVDVSYNTDLILAASKTWEANMKLFC